MRTLAEIEADEALLSGTIASAESSWRENGFPRMNLHTERDALGRLVQDARDLVQARQEAERAVEVLGGQPGESLQHTAERVRHEWERTHQALADLKPDERSPLLEQVREAEARLEKRLESMDEKARGALKLLVTLAASACAVPSQEVKAAEEKVREAIDDGGNVAFTAEGVSALALLSSLAARAGKMLAGMERLHAQVRELSTQRDELDGLWKLALEERDAVRRALRIVTTILSPDVVRGFLQAHPAGTRSSTGGLILDWSALERMASLYTEMEQWQPKGGVPPAVSRGEALRRALVAAVEPLLDHYVVREVLRNENINPNRPIIVNITLAHARRLVAAFTEAKACPAPGPDVAGDTAALEAVLQSEKTPTGTVVSAAWRAAWRLHQRLVNSAAALSELKGRLGKLEGVIKPFAQVAAVVASFNPPMSIRIAGPCCRMENPAVGLEASVSSLDFEQLHAALQQHEPMLPNLGPFSCEYTESAPGLPAREDKGCVHCGAQKDDVIHSEARRGEVAALFQNGSPQ